MAYFEFHDTLPDHPKTAHLAELLKVDLVTAVGYVACLFAWAIRFRPSGKIEKSSMKLATRSENHYAMTKALLDAGFMEREGSLLVIHDWPDYTKNYRKAVADRERLKGKRSATVAQLSRDKSGEQNRTEQSGKEQNRTDYDPDAAEFKKKRDKASEYARKKIAAHPSERIQHKLLEYLGFVENESGIPGQRIRDLIDRVWNLRASMLGDNGAPYDDIFCYSIDQAIKYKGVSAAYIGRVINESIIKWRDGCFKGETGKNRKGGTWKGKK